MTAWRIAAFVAGGLVAFVAGGLAFEAVRSSWLARHERKIAAIR